MDCGIYQFPPIYLNLMNLQTPVVPPQMELNLSSVIELLGTPLNDEDLYAICEKLCQVEILDD